MYENTTNRPKAVLVSVDIGEFDTEVSLEELEELAETAGVDVAGKVTQKRDTYDTATCIGSGRLEEIRDFCDQQEVDMLIFDHELTGTQLRNIEEIAQTAVLDRTMLILDIFAQRARTSEGKLQVELAQQKYRLPRLTGMGKALSRLGGGIGTRGPGESRLETDRRHIKRRIAALEEELAQLEKRRDLIRKRRKKDNHLTAAIVGYTNAGKSTLLNALTHADVLAENQLFATLDLTSRSVELPDGKSVILVDTVGFIRRLPHQLIEAFQSTLEEAANADLILLVCDSSSEELDSQLSVCEKLLAELGCGGIPTLRVYNKCDKLPYLPDIRDGGVLISAKTGQGFDLLLKRIAEELGGTSRRMQLCIPYAEAGFIARIREDGKVFAEEYTDQGIMLDALVDYRLLRQAEQYLAPPDPDSLEE
ncbi:MAG TPA: GTPase HflX [Firmicutes bacterium]|nr:GTPase HflX [Bacillota bacterium]